MDRYSLYRRSYLALVAAGAIPATALPAQAASGYGTGGYGESAYGSSSDSTDDGDGDDEDVGDVVDDYPTIRQFDLSDSSPPNPHVEIAVEWAVSHDESALESVYVEARSQSGQVIGTSTTTVTGAEASSTDLFTIDHATGEAFIVSIFVTDTAQHTTTDYDRLDTSRRSSTNSKSQSQGD